MVPISDIKPVYMFPEVQVKQGQLKILPLLGL